MKYLCSELRKMILSWKFWIAVFLNYGMCWGALALKEISSTLLYRGTLNVFIWSVIDNELVSLIAPIAAVIVYTTSMCDDFDSGSIKNTLLNMNRSNYLNVKTVCSLIAGALPVLLGLGGYFATLLITHPGISIKFKHYTGYVRIFYDRSMLLFSLLYILHVAACSALMSLLGMGIAASARNRYLGVIVPVALQFLLLFSCWIAIIPELTRALYVVIPSSLYKYLYEPLGQTVYDFVIVFAGGMFTVVYAWKKWRSGAESTD